LLQSQSSLGVNSIYGKPESQILSARHQDGPRFPFPNDSFAVTAYIHCAEKYKQYFPRGNINAKIMISTDEKSQGTDSTNTGAHKKKKGRD
jgi:hypothetical protein